MIHIFFAYVVIIIHILIILFAFIGCILPIQFVQYHIFVFPIIYIQWKLNNQKCILNDIEYTLLNNTHDTLWRTITKYIHTLNIKDDEITYILLVLFTIPCVISLVRIFMYYKK